MKQQKDKFTQWKEAVRDTPPERLLKISMQGHVLSTIGLLVVTIVLTMKGIWWISLAFIFSTLNNYSGFVSSWKQRHEIIELHKELNLPEQEVTSPHLKKTGVIKEVFGIKAGWISSFVAVLMSYLIFGNPQNLSWYVQPVLFLTIIVIYYIVYFKLFYYLSKFIRRLEE